MSDQNIDLTPSPKLEGRKERKKRNSRRKTTNKLNTAIKEVYETDKVCIQGYTFFDDDFNIDKVCM